MSPLLPISSRLVPRTCLVFEMFLGGFANEIKRGGVEPPRAHELRVRQRGHQPLHLRPKEPQPGRFHGHHLIALAMLTFALDSGAC